MIQARLEEIDSTADVDVKYKLFLEPRDDQEVAQLLALNVLMLYGTVELISLPRKPQEKFTYDIRFKPAKT
jgi:hypothetical protein